MNVAMPLVYLPDPNAFFLWGDHPATRALPSLTVGGAASRAELVTPDGRRVVDGLALPLFDTMARLAVVPAASLDAVSGSIATWIVASKLAIELVSRERVVPTITRRGGRIEARWAAALSASEDAAKVVALANSMPPAAHAVPVSPASPAVPAVLDVWAPEALVRAYLDAVVDALVRSARGGPELPAGKAARARTGGDPAGSLRAPWEQRWRLALEGPERSFEAHGFAERSVVEDLERWSEPAVGARDRLRACFRLELPEADRDPFVLRFLLQSPDDPSLLVAADEVWRTKGRSLEKLGRAFRDPQESLLEALGRASRLFAPIERALGDARPEALALDPATAWSFLGDGAAALAEAGFGVIVPGELTASGQRRLRLRMRVGGKATSVAGVVAGTAGLAMEELLTVDWDAVLGDDALTARELMALAKQKAPLVRYRGAWVAIDPRELAEIQRRIAGGPTRMTVREGVQAALAGEAQQGALSVAVAATGGLAAMLDRLRQSASLDVAIPAGLRATLRPYQERGLAWLSAMGGLGLGACLADDMGLGKTVQLLAFLLRRAAEAPGDKRPALLVAPTSVVGNWEREVARFAPSLSITQHYGAGRVRGVDGFPDRAGSLVVTTYGLLRRDAELLAGVAWSAVVLDEAQNIKNAASATARAARRLRASHRFALTGTPVENRLGDLWSIYDFLDPGLLGSAREFSAFVKRLAERRDESYAPLRRLIQPYLLRRLKTDRAIVADLPDKTEVKAFCLLSKRQAGLYQQTVDELERAITGKAQGIERRGLVLAYLMRLKQICNHPAHWLGESAWDEDGSGKLTRLREIVGPVAGRQEKLLLFTQFREATEPLAAFLAELFGRPGLVLHGSTPVRDRGGLVKRFQDDPAVPFFVLSVKAGGTGLNLTAASHVVHFDRWWNPAVEDQATDRAYRIGQHRNVLVHKLVCRGTVEERIDRLIEDKQALARGVLTGGGETRLTELSDAELMAMVALDLRRATAEA
jgi:superfamily II DNA or RNA helicase